ncbi:MAG: hypothetical protein AAB593_01775 [Patescibacteria group bacterium]
MLYQKETKQCQNCKQNFTIDLEDFEFYNKIQVPSPTFCPECRMVRRMLWRNERALYKRKCDAPGHSEDIISIYHEDSRLKVYDNKYWWSDDWDSMDYGRDYDFNKPFFEQFEELVRDVPQQNLFTKNVINSFYCNWAKDIKNCYLSFGLHDVENCMYSSLIPYTKDSSDCMITRNSELCYQTVDCLNSHKLFYSQNCESCVNSYFLYDCKNCSDCIGCIGLRNKQYYIFNKKYNKEEYFKKLKEFNLGCHKTISEIKEKFNELNLKYPRKFANILKSFNIVGDNISNAKNCFYCFNSSKDLENLKFANYAVDRVKDSYDINFGGMKSELCYDVISCIGFKVFFVVFILEGYNVQYSFNCHNSNNLFGCVGLRNKEYCILNKQYTKEEYEKLVPSIIEHMNNMPYIDKKGRVYKYGEFFPAELSPFAYNEIIAQEYFSLTKEQAIEQGYKWKEQEERNYNIDIKTQDILDDIKYIENDIIGKIIECEHQGKCNEQCVTAFKIIQREFEFYKKQNIPIPRLCPNCRYYQRIKQRNPLKLWHRKCQCAGKTSDNKVYKNTIEHPNHKQEHCSVEFETSYSPDRQEIVYCEKCYQAEVV